MNLFRPSASYLYQKQRRRREVMGRALEIVAALFVVTAVAWVVIAQRMGIWRGLREGREAKRRPDRSKHRPF